MSNDSSPTHGYPDFPPSPDSWLDESIVRTNQTTNSTPAVDYWNKKKTNVKRKTLSEFNHNDTSETFHSIQKCKLDNLCTSKTYKIK